MDFVMRKGRVSDKSAATSEACKKPRVAGIFKFLKTKRRAL